MFVRMTLLGVWMALSGASQQPPDSTAAAASTTAARPAGDLSPRNANYRITARLDPWARTITGDEMLTWRNATARRAAYAQVDPERILLLDVNTTNNSASLKPQARSAARKWSLAWLLWMQDHLLTYGFFV